MRKALHTHLLATFWMALVNVALNFSTASHQAAEVGVLTVFFNYLITFGMFSVLSFPLYAGANIILRKSGRTTLADYILLSLVGAILFAAASYLFFMVYLQNILAQPPLSQYLIAIPQNALPYALVYWLAYRKKPSS